MSILSLEMPGADGPGSKVAVVVEGPLTAEDVVAAAASLSTTELDPTTPNRSLCLLRSRPRGRLTSLPTTPLPEGGGIPPNPSFLLLILPPLLLSLLRLPRPPRRLTLPLPLPQRRGPACCDSPLSRNLPPSPRKPPHRSPPNPPSNHCRPLLPNPKRCLLLPGNLPRQLNRPPLPIARLSSYLKLLCHPRTISLQRRTSTSSRTRRIVQSQTQWQVRLPIHGTHGLLMSAQPAHPFLALSRSRRLRRRPPAVTRPRRSKRRSGPLSVPRAINGECSSKKRPCGCPATVIRLTAPPFSLARSA